MSSCSEPQSKGTVLITGAASGIGKATAELFAQRGWCCVLLDRDLERLWQLKSQLVSSNHQKHLCRVLDLTDPAAIQSLGQDLPELDALINNAGMGMVGAVEDSTKEDILKLFNLNLVGAVQMKSAVMPKMREQKSGKIINVSSIGSEMGLPFRGFYSASKSALDKVVEAMRSHLPECWYLLQTCQSKNDSLQSTKFSLPPEPGPNPLDLKHWPLFLQ